MVFIICLISLLSRFNLLISEINLKHIFLINCFPYKVMKSLNDVIYMKILTAYVQKQELKNLPVHICRVSLL